MIFYRNGLTTKEKKETTISLGKMLNTSTDRRHREELLQWMKTQTEGVPNKMEIKWENLP